MSEASSEDMKRDRAVAPASSIRESYRAFVAEVKERIQALSFGSRSQLTANSSCCIDRSAGIFDRQNRERWGAKVIDRLSVDLKRALPDMQGFSPRNLKYMRAFAEASPENQLCNRLHNTLGHNVRILDLVKAPQDREWYVGSTIQRGWSRDVLVHQIDSGLHRRQGAAITNFSRALPAPQSDLAQQVTKDPYNFDFLMLGKTPMSGTWNVVFSNTCDNFFSSSVLASRS